MNDILEPQPHVASGRTAPVSAPAVGGEWTPLAFRLELQSLQALLSVLATVSRLGGRLAFVRADGTQAVVGVLALPHTEHRVELLLTQLVEVIAVAATAWPAGVELVGAGA